TYVSNILLTKLDGNNIGTSWDNAAQGRTFMGDRDHFEQILQGYRFAIGEPVRGRTTGKWVATFGRAGLNRSGQLVAQLAIGIQLERFQEVLRMRRLPDATVVQIVNEHGTVIARSIEAEKWVGRNLRKDEQFADHLGKTEVNESVRWPDG